MVKKILAKGYVYLTLLFLYAPIAVLVIYSFTPSITMQWQGFSFDLYKDLFDPAESAAILDALKNTIIIATVASVISTIIGIFAAIGIYNMKNRSKEAMLTVSKIPMMNAEIVTGVSLMLLFLMFGIPYGMVTVIIAHIEFCTPYVILSIIPKLQQMDNNLYEAALDLGCTPMKALFKAILPQILPGVISGFFLAFTLSIDDFVITIFNIQGINTLSTFIYADAAKNGLTPSLRALSTMILVSVLVLLVIVNIITHHDKKSKTKAVVKTKVGKQNKTISKTKGANV